MVNFKKPTAVARDAKVLAYKAVNGKLPDDTRRGYTDKIDFVAPNVAISYKHKPSPAIRELIRKGVNMASNIIRHANDEVAGIVMLRRKESLLFQQVVAMHFNMAAGDLSNNFLKSNEVNRKFSVRAIVEKDRRWVLEKIREKLLSISFHLNTGVYIIDSDNARRDISSGRAVIPASRADEAYVSAKKTMFDDDWRASGWDFKGGLLAGFHNGEIHIDFAQVPTWSTISLARIIIHEATHKYLNTEDEAYAWDPNYSSIGIQRALNNADSFAWAAVSLYCGSVKMDNIGKCPLPDWRQCTKT